MSTLGTQLTEPSGLAGLTHVFPRPERFTPKALVGLGMPKTRAMCLAGIADAVIADRHLFDPRRDLAEAVARLRELAGIGEWTAQYIAMRALGESDAFLAADIGLQRSFARQWTASDGADSCWLAPSDGDRGARTPRCTCGWPTQTPPKLFRQRRLTMHLRLERYTSPFSPLLLVTDEDGALRALDFADHESRMHRLLARALRRL